MKLFVIASVIAMASAARLEHLERGYLPPFGGQTNTLGSGSTGLGPNGQGLNGFGPNSGIGARRAPQAGPFGAATSNQYLPPDHGPSAGLNAFEHNQSPSYRSNNQSPFGSQPGQFGSSGQSGFGNQPSVGLQSPFIQPSSQYGTPQFGASPNYQSGPGFGSSFSRPSSQYQPSQYQPSQYSATNRQYLAPKSSPSFQNIPQQDFDEETGYHY